MSLLTVPPDERDRQVTMSNRLARAAHGLNLAEKRLVALGVVSTDRATGLPIAARLGDKGECTLRVTVQQYARAFDVDTTTAYEQMRAAGDNLFERYVRYEEPGPRGPKEVKFRWVSSCSYAKGEGYVELTFSSKVTPHLQNLAEHITTYRLGQASGFQSVYAWRLFELLKSCESTGVYEMTIEEFWTAVDAPPSCRKDFKALRTRVIEPAVEEIRVKSKLRIEWEKMCSGSKRVSGLRFSISVDPQGRLDIDADAAALMTADLQAVATP